MKVKDMKRLSVDAPAAEDLEAEVRRWESERWRDVAMARAAFETANGELRAASSWYGVAADLDPHSPMPVVFLISVLRALDDPGETTTWERLRLIDPESASIALDTIEAVDEHTRTVPDALNDALVPDLIMVLGYQLQRDGRPHARLVGRLEAAERLTRRLPDASVLLSGGAIGETRLSEGSVMERHLLRKGVDPRRIMVERYSRDTLENVEYARQFVRDGGFRSVVLVSEEPHLTRGATLLELTGWFEHVARYGGPPHREFNEVELAATYRDALRLRRFALPSDRVEEMEARLVPLLTSATSDAVETPFRCL